MDGFSELWGLTIFAKATLFGAGRGADKNLPFLFAVYTIIWIVLFGYIFFLARKNRELRKEVDSLKGSLGAKKNSK